jgi:hypothetical protein
MCQNSSLEQRQYCCGIPRAKDSKMRLRVEEDTKKRYLGAGDDSGGVAHFKVYFLNRLLKLNLNCIFLFQARLLAELMIFVSVQPSPTTLFRVPFPLPTPQGRRDSQLRTMPQREIRTLRKATPMTWRPL